jgi:hypothetical protein
MFEPGGPHHRQDRQSMADLMGKELHQMRGLLSKGSVSQRMD